MAKIFVIAGHGAGDPGAVGNGCKEADMVRKLADKIKQLGGNSVTVGDTSRNWYADNGISKLTIPKDTQLLELHMDSGPETAKGGHVIIKKGFKPDKYDNALANVLKTIFPGRSEIIQERSNLANVNRAASKGYSYRLIEVGFITNKNDVNVFNKKLDVIALEILKAFGIKIIDNTSKEPVDTYGYHIVKTGETLSGIAFRYKTTYQKIAKLNNLSDPNIIKVGQKLRVK